MLHCPVADAMACMSTAAAALQSLRCRLGSALYSECSDLRKVRMLESAAVSVQAAQEAPQQLTANEMHINMSGMSTCW